MPTSIGSLDCQTYGRTIRWTEAGDRPLPDGKVIYPRSVIGGVIRLVEHPGAKMPEQHATEMDAQELLRLYDNGRRDFSDLEFLKYLDLHNVALPQIVLRNCWLDGNFSDSNLEFADFSASSPESVGDFRGW